MPLPSGGTTWPPQHLQCIYDQYAIWNAWYTGNPDDLATAYGDNSVPRLANRPSQYRGGLVGTLSRFFWGAPTPRGERRTKLHVPLAADLASTSADLLYSEPPNAVAQDARTQQRLDELADDGLHAVLIEQAEIGAALGGAFLRVCWDKKAVPGGPWIDVIHPDAALPEWRYGRLAAVTFWRVVEDDGKVCRRHLERHEPGKISHGLYEGGYSSLGAQVPLTASDATKDLQPEVPTQIDKLTAVYVPHMKPNRLWRSTPAGANLGRPDIAGVESLLDSLDEVYTSWIRDIRLAKSRIIVPSSYLQNLGPGKGAAVDLDREVYEAIDALPGQGMEITPNQFAIRWAEHQNTAQDLIQQILRAAGYSAQTFGLTGDAAMTATEVVARERRSFTTRDRQIVYQRPALADIYETWLMIDAKFFDSGVTPEKPDLEFGDSVSEDPQSLAQTAQVLRTAEAASTETLVRLVHPEWDDEQVLMEVQKIKDDQPAPVADPFALRPDTGQEDQPAGPPADGGQDPAEQDPAVEYQGA